MQKKIDEFLDGIKKEISKISPLFAQSPVVKTKYQSFKFLLTAGSPANVEIDKLIDPRYKRITDIFMYTDEDITANVNLTFDKDLRISDEEVYPVDFDTFMLYPIMQNQEFTKLREPIALKNSKVEGHVITTDNIASTCYLRLILKMEE